MVSFLPLATKVSHSVCWHARLQIQVCTQLSPILLLCLLSYLFRRRSLDHSNIIEGRKRDSLGSVLFWEEKVRYTCNSFLNDSIFFLTHLFSSAGFLFQLTSIVSGGSGSVDRHASRFRRNAPTIVPIVQPSLGGTRRAANASVLQR